MNSENNRGGIKMRNPVGINMKKDEIVEVKNGFVNFKINLC